MSEIITWSEPYPGKKAIQVMKAVAHKGLRPALGNLCTPLLQRVVEACWAEPHTSRPSFVDVLAQVERMLMRAEAHESVEAVVEADRHELDQNGT